MPDLGLDDYFWFVLKRECLNQSSTSDPCHMVKGYVGYSDSIHQGVHIIFCSIVDGSV